MLTIDLAIVSRCFNNGLANQESAGAVEAVCEQEGGKVRYKAGQYFGNVGQNVAELHAATLGLMSVKREHRGGAVRLFTNCYFIIRVLEKKPNGDYKNSFNKNKTEVDVFRSLVAGFPSLQVNHTKTAPEMDNAIKVLEDVLAIKMPLAGAITLEPKNERQSSRPAAGQQGDPGLSDNWRKDAGGIIRGR